MYVHYNLIVKERVEDLDHREEAVKYDLRSLLTDDGSFIEIGEFGPDELDGCNLWGILGSEEEPENLVDHSRSTGTPIRRSPRRAPAAADGSCPAPAPAWTTRRSAFDSEDDDVPLSHFRPPPRRSPGRAAAVGPSESPRRSPRNSPLSM